MKHRNLGLVAFGVTTCVLAPTAVHVLRAGPKQVAKLVAPGNRSITIGATKVDIAVDRAFVDPGDKVHLTLTATADRNQRVTVAVLVFESTGTGGGRVETPPTRIGRDEITLDVAHGSATKQLAFTLPGHRGAEMEGQEPFGHYTILVMPPMEADQLEALRRRASHVDNAMDDRGGRVAAFEEAYRSIDREPPAAGSDDPDPQPAFGKPGQIARLDVNTRPKGSPVSIVSPEAAHVGDELAITVRVHNPSKLALSGVTVSLAPNGFGIANDYLGLAEDQVTITGGDEPVALAGRETKEVVFHVTAKAAGVLGLFARAQCEADDCDKDPAASAINDVALDAVDITPAEQAPTVVVK